MMIKVSQDILRDDEFRIEIKSNFISNNLGDDLSFKAQYERFKDYKFDTLMKFMVYIIINQYLTLYSIILIN